MCYLPLFAAAADWPGIAIANRLTATVGVQPWRFDTAEYIAHARADGLRLEGAPVRPSWSPGLYDAMLQRGVALHEEAVVEDLLEELHAQS